MRTKLAVVAGGLAIAFAGSVVQAQAVHVTAGTAVRVRLVADLLSAQAVEGARVDMELAQPVVVQGAVAIPQGSVVWGAVQVAKKGKVLRFDVEGVRLPDMRLVKLRCSPQRTSIAVKDEIKVETQVGGDLGAAKGSEYTAYLDEDVNVEVAGTPAAPAQSAPVVAPPPPAQPAAPIASPATAATPAAVATPTPKPAAPSVAPAAVTAAPAPVTAAPEVPAPTSPATATPTHAGPAVQPGEYITVECFSDPLGADIFIDDEYHGNTPSILKLQPGNHQIEFRLMGYKPHPQPLNIPPGSGLRTVRATLDKEP